MVDHAPLAATIEREELLASDHERPPTRQPPLPLRCRSADPEGCSEFWTILVHAQAPRIERSRIVTTVDPPGLTVRERIHRHREPVLRGHHPPGEEVSGHPVAAATDLEQVGTITMGEHVDEQFASWAQPAGDALS